MRPCAGARREGSLRKRPASVCKAGCQAAAVPWARAAAEVLLRLSGDPRSGVKCGTRGPGRPRPAVRFLGSARVHARAVSLPPGSLYSCSPVSETLLLLQCLRGLFKIFTSGLLRNRRLI